MKLTTPFRQLFGMSQRDHGHIPLSPDDGDPQHVYYPNVPFVHQNHINLCGDACVAMLLLHHKKTMLYRIDKASVHVREAVWTMRENPRGIVQGADPDELAGVFIAAGLFVYNVQPCLSEAWSEPSLRRVLTVFGPFMAALESDASGHWILITGVLNNTVYCHDPWRGRNLSMTMDAFQHKNNGYQAGLSIAVSSESVESEPAKLSAVTCQRYCFGQH